MRIIFKATLTGLLTLSLASQFSCNAGQSISTADKEVEEAKQQPKGNAIFTPGIYVATEWQRPIPDYVLNDKNVDGVFERLYWAPFNPAKDKYDWTFIDSEMDRLAAAGKKVSIGIMAGSRCPEWIYTEGVPSVGFKEFPNMGKVEGELNVTIPVPWDTKFLTYYNIFIDEFAKHIKSKPEWYNAVSLIKMTGINLTTIEIRLPAQKEIENLKGEKSSDAYSIWLSKGYNSQKVKNAWTSITENYNKNFPDKHLSLAYIPDRGFPYIDEKGKVIEKKPENDLTRWMITDGYNRFGKRFIIQFNALNVKKGTHVLIAQNAAKGFITGYQLNQIELAKPTCLENKTPCDEVMFKAVMDNGIKDGASFIEIFQRDVQAYPKSVEYAHKKMNNNKPK